jgi:hypothetical protein
MGSLRHILLVGAAIGAAAMAPAFAADFAPPPVFVPPPPVAVQAHVDLYGGFFTADNFDPGESGFVFGGAGRANVPLDGSRNLQLDAQGSTLIFTSGAFTESFGEVGGYAHWYARDPASHALGLFAGADFFAGDPQVYTAGVEGQMYWPAFTLHGQASLSSVQSGSTSGLAFQLRAEGQWFLAPDTVLLADVMWVGVDDFYDDNASFLTLLAQLQHRFNGGPFSGFVRARYDRNNFDDPDFNVASAVVGVRVQADPPGSTEMSHRRTGPAMDVLPMFVGGGPCFGTC